jgi:hypothetical protein
VIERAARKEGGVVLPLHSTNSKEAVGRGGQTLNLAVWPDYYYWLVGRRRLLLLVWDYWFFFYLVNDKVVVSSAQ